MKTKIKELAIYALILSIGYVIGSIHAPFEVRWRSDNALPMIDSGFDMATISDEGIE